MRRTTIEHLRRLTPRSTLALAALLAAVLTSGLWACSRQASKTSDTAPEQAATQEAPAAAADQGVEQSSGQFELALAGDVEGAYKGTASCVLEESSETLRATLDPHGASDYLYYVTVPDYDDNTADYDGTFEMSGGERSSGPVSVGISREDDDTGFFERQLTIAFEGQYSGAAGTGTVKGEVHCGLPAIGDTDQADQQGATDGQSEQAPGGHSSRSASAGETRNIRHAG